VVTQYTMPHMGDVQATVFAPTDQLHFVDSEGCYTRGKKSEPDPTQVRVIPFNSKWVAEMLLKGKAEEAQQCTAESKRLHANVA
jgi:hypothetical protein